jgi:HEAT repeat protein
MSSTRAPNRDLDEQARLESVRALEGGTDRAVEDLSTALADRSWRVRKEAVVKAAEWPQPARLVEALIDLVERSNDPVPRNAAVEALTALGKSAVGPLCQAVEAGSPARKMYVDCLGMIGDIDSVETLIGSLDDEDENVRMAAAEALGGVGTAHAAEALERHLEDEGLLVRVASLDALWRIGHRVSLSPLLPMLGDRSLRRPAVRLLGLTGTHEAVPHVAEALADELAGVREAALEAATALHGVLRHEHGELLEKAVRQLSEEKRAILARSLQSGSDHIRRAAAVVLAWSRDPLLVEPLLKATLDEETGESAADALYTMAPTVIPAIGTLVASPSAELRMAVYNLVSRIPGIDNADTDTLIEQAIADLAARDPDTAPAAAQALGACGGVDAVSPLADALCSLDVDPLLAQEAATALGRIGRRSRRPVVEAVLARQEEIDAELLGVLVSHLDGTEFIGLLERLAEDLDPFVRLEAVHALSGLSCKEGAEIGAKAMGDDDPMVRTAAARALGRFSTMSSLEKLRRALEDPDEEVRAAAARSLGQLGDMESALKLAALAQRADSPAVALAAFEALKAMGKSSDSALVADLLARDDPEIIKSALESLSDRSVGAELLDASIDKLFHPAWDVRLEAVRAVASQTDDPRAVEALNKLLDEETDGLVRKVARQVVDQAEKAKPK